MGSLSYNTANDRRWKTQSLNLTDIGVILFMMQVKRFKVSKSKYSVVKRHPLLEWAPPGSVFGMIGRRGDRQLK